MNKTIRMVSLICSLTGGCGDDYADFEEDSAAPVLEQQAGASSTGTWTVTKRLPMPYVIPPDLPAGSPPIYNNVRFSWNYANTPVPRSVPGKPDVQIKVRQVRWRWVPYGNGGLHRVRICFLEPYETIVRLEADGDCVDVSQLQAGITTAFTGMDARGAVVLNYQVYGGKYPWYATEESTVWVDYEPR